MGAQCMHCRGAWSNEFLFQSLPYADWSEEMKRKRMEWLLEREKSLLVNAQEALEYYGRALSIRQEAEKVRILRNKMNDQLRTLRKEADKLDVFGHILLNSTFNQVGKHGLLGHGKTKINLVPCPTNDCFRV